MTVEESPTITLARALGWRGGILVIVGLSVLTIILTTLARHIAALTVIASILTTLQIVAWAVIGGYGLWILVGLGALLHSRVTPPATATGVTLLLRFPPPRISASATTATVRGGAADAVATTEMLRGLMALIRPGMRVALELWRTSTHGVEWIVWVSDPALVPTLVGFWNGVAPGCELAPIADPLTRRAAVVLWREYGLALDSIYPISGANEALIEPLGPLIGALTPHTDVAWVGVQWVCALPSAHWERHAARHMRRWHTTERTTDPTIAPTAKAVLEKAQAPVIAITMRVVIGATTLSHAAAQHAAIERALGHTTVAYGREKQRWAVVTEDICPY